MDEAILQGSFQQYPQCQQHYRLQVSKTGVVFYEQQEGGQTSPRNFTSIQISDVIGSKIYQSKIPNDTSAYFKIVAFRANKKGVRVMQCYTFRVHDSDDEQENTNIAHTWSRTLAWLVDGTELNADQLQEKEDYPPSKRFLILINPKSGQGKSIQLYKQKFLPLLNESNVTFTTIITEYAGHGVDIARDLDVEEYDTVIICSGDGLMYEVVNGFMQREDWERAIKMPLAILPTGSGNGLAASIMWACNEEFNLGSCMYIALKGKPHPLDLYSLTTTKRKLYGFLSVTWGLTSDVDIESEKFRALGKVRFTLGAIQRIISLRHYKGQLHFLPLSSETRTNDEPIGATLNGFITNGNPGYPNGATANGAVMNGNSDSLNGANKNDFKTSSSYQRLKEDSIDEEEINEILKHTSEKGRRKTLGEEDSVLSKKVTRTNTMGEFSDLEMDRTVPLRPVYGPDSKYPSLNEPIPDDWITVDDEFVTVMASSVSHLGYDLVPRPHGQPIGSGFMSLQFIRGGIKKKMLLEMLDKFSTGKHLDMPEVEEMPIAAFRLVPGMDRVGYIAVDGEMTDYGPIQGEVLTGVARIISVRDCRQ